MPDDTDGERLVVLLEARIKDFENNLKKASGTATTNYAKMRKDSAAATKQLETDMDRATSRINAMLVSTGSRMGAFGRSFSAGALAPVAGLLTLTGAIAGTRAALDKFGAIADKSKAAGLDPEFFQGIAYQAKLSGVEIDTVAGALATFAKNAGLAAEGKGRMVSALQALNPELLKNIQLSTTQEQRIKLVSDAIAGAKDQAQAAAIASAAFGDAGVKMVDALSGGGAALDSMIAKAKEMGIIIDRDTIAKADELGDKFDTLTGIIDNKLKQSLINVAPILVSMAGTVADITQHLSEWVKYVDHIKQVGDLTSPVSARTDDVLNDQLRSLGLKARDLDNIIRQTQATLQNSPLAWLNKGALNAQIDDATAKLKENEAEQASILAELERRHKLNIDAGDADEAQKKLDALAETARNLTNSNILIHVSADTKAAADAIAKIASLAPELRSPQQQAKDALNQALGSGDSIMRAAAVDAYNKTLAALDEADRRSAAKGAGKALATKSRELSDAYDRIVASANARIGQSRVEAQALGLPQEAADRLRYTFELLSQAEQEGIELDPKKRKELTDLAAEMAHADAVTRKFTDAFDKQKEAIDSVADAFSGLFSKPWTNWTDMVDDLLGSFASIGQTNLKDGITSLLNGSFGKTANDNGGTGPFAGAIATASGSVRVNVTNPKDIATGIGGLFKGNPALAQGLGVAAGAVGIGFQSANPIMGGIGGALSGLATGNPIMAVAGGLTGRIGSIKEIKT